ncbi:DUF4351 domain-containing protein [Fischerella thermalis]|uniref:DUF4351 domain-containing protein n=1 Tax=Fischerella thermalis TaxID=372787 RepID=UPI0009FCAC43|nr:DUF4351 domain-containing protein [Fischerella thermalis]PLZ10879.1 hypothetical protein CBP18_10045 [Fischerella thermalis WC119]PLZ18420.1 hypothetical protein CBP29_19900 [Fischerella thermalis WC341]PLZ62255.1 hypothetical protein CBP23_10770 [Fischerella thermalis WC344]PLZ67728.1 hypothetical protein CBP22_12315 [Fischerella thermalis WC249]RDH47760.1 hypothetical protein CA946_18535 [Fischerella thermalis 111/344/542]RDH49737.1 hypothetical protein CBF18_14035 [Mastigocladus laminos
MDARKRARPDLKERGDLSEALLDFTSLADLQSWLEALQSYGCALVSSRLGKT